MKVEIDVFSDVVCPWCYIGKRRLEKALTLLGGEFEPSVRWRAFELNPNMPKQGMDRRAYRAAKFGSPERSRQLEEHVSAEGATEGIEFAFDRIERIPNTFDAHCVIAAAADQDTVVERLFRAYFLDGSDVGSPEVLREIAGGPAPDIAQQVRNDERRAHALGISGVPFFMVNGQPMIAGAVRSDLLAGLIREAAHGRYPSGLVMPGV